jgi:importin subunit beta-1
MEIRPHYNFSRVASNEVIPTLLTLLTKQDEDAGDDDYNVSRAAYQCLQLFAQCVGNEIVGSVLNFVEQNLRDTDWHKRDAAVSAFGAIMEGPDEKMLEPLVKQALPLLMDKMQDDAVQVRDSAAYAIGRVCDLMHESIDAQTQLPVLIETLFGGLSSNPKMAGSCCWALMSLADKFAGEPGCPENALSPHYQGSVTALLAVTEK